MTGYNIGTALRDINETLKEIALELRLARQERMWARRAGGRRNIIVNRDDDD